MNSVDIILPTYNCEKYIEETINSIISQSFESWRLIIIDDKSNMINGSSLILGQSEKSRITE